MAVLRENSRRSHSRISASKEVCVPTSQNKTEKRGEMREGGERVAGEGFCVRLTGGAWEDRILGTCSLRTKTRVQSPFKKRSSFH